MVSLMTIEAFRLDLMLSQYQVHLDLASTSVWAWIAGRASSYGLSLKLSQASSASIRTFFLAIISSDTFRIEKKVDFTPSF